MRTLPLVLGIFVVGCGGGQKPAATPVATATPVVSPLADDGIPAKAGKTQLEAWNVELDFAKADLQVQAGANDISVVNSWEGHKTVGDAVFQLTLAVEKDHIDSEELAKAGRIQIAQNGFNPEPGEPAELMGVPGVSFTAVNPKGVQLYMFIAMAGKCSYTLMVGPAETRDEMLGEAKELMAKLRPISGAAAVPARCQ